MKVLNLKLMLMLVICLMPFLRIYAQLDYRPGYIINGKNDTVKGYILYSAKNLSVSCAFKTSPDAEVVSYKPFEINSFRFNEGNYFVSRKVFVNNDTNAVFLQFLVKGKLNLYYLRDGTDHYFIEKDNLHLMEISEDEKIFRDKYGDQYEQRMQYVGKLKYVLADCPAISGEIEHIRMSNASLIRLSKDYHNKMCTTQQCEIYVGKAKPVRVNYCIQFGLSLNSFQFGGQLASGNGTNKVVGIRFQFENLVKWSDRTFFTIDLNLQQFSKFNLVENGSNHDFITYDKKLYYLTGKPAGSGDISNLDVDFKAVSLKIPLTISRTFLAGKFNPYAGVGVENTLMIIQNKDLVINRYADKYDKTFPLYYYGFIARAGSKYNLGNHHSIYIDLNYEYSSTLNMNQFLSISNNIFSVMAGFSF